MWCWCFDDDYWVSQVVYALRNRICESEIEVVNQSTDRLVRSLSLTSNNDAKDLSSEPIDTVMEYVAVEGVDRESGAMAMGPYHTASLTWKDFSVTLPKTGAKLIDNVSGMVSSGRILALMGPSGAGKTTLLNGLAGRAPYAKVTGSVTFAGRNMTSADLTYVPQFDELNRILTVEEHILLVGHLTCTDTLDMRKRVGRLISVLGLKNKRNTKLANLSSGEVKRVSVGIGMISNPNVLFLDGDFLPS
jgi:ABC-type multidrug transport system ATPase subunit